MTDRYYLGLDLGSVSLDAVVLDDRHNICWWRYRRVEGWPQKTLLLVLRDLMDEFVIPGGIKRFDGALATGSGKDVVREKLGIPVVNEIVAHGMAALREVGGEASVIEIGGQDSKFIQVDHGGPSDYSMNELCAAGTGSFLDVQAERLGISIEELSRLAAGAERIPAVAGRCSVFAKSDIVHLQQRGTPLDEIVAGLCFALARNYIATLIRGREIKTPVVFQGGVSLNDGVIRAFCELLDLSKEDMVRPELPHLMGAIGAAAMSSEWESEKLTIRKITRSIKKARIPEKKGFSSGKWDLERKAGDPDEELESFEIDGEETSSGKELFLGLDVGSVSTDAVLIEAGGEIAARVYIMTRGKPLEAAARALGYFGKRFMKEQVRAVGVTGSGRKLVGHVLGADVIVDEITAQARGARAFDTEADTVIEIGGQDAKFIKIDESGLVTTFEMNRACSAGTGSFIQEQAARLNVDLKRDFASMALSAKEQVSMASRCTVFMESDLVHHVQRGCELGSLLMGVSTAVVENYLGRVAMGQVPGQKIMLQGGIAKNAAVVKAFRDKLKDSDVRIHPWPELSGAIGAAYIARERSSRGGIRTRFDGFNLKADYTVRHFTCKRCENRCEVNVFSTEAGRFCFGDICGRYAEKHGSGRKGCDHTEKITGQHEESGKGKQRERNMVVGIPRALLYHEYGKFWNDFFEELGIDTITSGATSEKIFNRGLRRLPAETCMPVKILFGHAATLVESGVDALFIPGPGRIGDYRSCIYVQHAPAMISSVWRDVEVLSFALHPFLDDRETRSVCTEVSDRFSLPYERVAGAYLKSRAHYLDHSDTLTGTPEEGKEQGQGQGQGPVAVMIGKPYVRADRYMNLALSSKLARTGFDVMYSSQLPGARDCSIPAGSDQIKWFFNREMLAAGARVMERDNWFPVVLTNFGCGPDSFTIPLLGEIFCGKPALFLEMDEHRADAGLETRVEAFYECVRQWREREAGEVRVGPASKEATPCLLSNISSPGEAFENNSTRKPSNLFMIPRFSDHAFAFAGALRAAQYDARVLPLPDRSVLEIGTDISGGKQCHPFQLISGDIVRLAVDGELPFGATYLFPVQSCSNCLINQYVPTIQRYLDRIGRSDVTVIGTTKRILIENLGPINLLNLGRGIVGIEYLLRLRHEIRPYETKKGRTDRAYDAAMKVMVDRLKSGKAYDGIVEAIGVMEKVRTRGRGTRPVIGVAGDVYTRINPSANAGLFELLEDLGCEVWISPTIFDITLTGSEIKVQKSWKDRNYRSMTYSWATAWLQRMEIWRIQKRFKGLLRNLNEPDWETIERYIDGLLPGDPDLMVILNVAKHMDFAQKGVDGILNVFCLNCMVGTSTAAIFPAIRERTGNVPMMSLVFDGLGNTHTRNRMEAFVHRVKRHHRERMESLSISPDDRYGNLFKQLIERLKTLGKIKGSG